MRFETRAIHDGQQPDTKTGAVVVPVYQTSTFEQDAPGKDRGYEYSRTGNPTRTALETAIASLEGARHGLAYASGVAATAGVIHLLSSGDHIISANDLYAGTWRLFDKVYAPWGLQTSYVDMDDHHAVENAVRSNTRLIWIETPSNPLLKIVDIRAIADIAHRHNLLLAVDNTFLSPCFQRPIEFGADIVVHSTTKYLGGHSDIIGGAVVTSNADVYQKLKYNQNALGAVPGPWDVWLTLRGIRTLAVRMRQHDANARYLAEFLEQHPRVERVYYPGLSSHRYHDLAKRQMDGFGGMITIELKGDRQSIEQFFSRLRIFKLADSLGGVESLIAYPPAMSHGAFSKEERDNRGITDNLVRISVGIEDKEDLKQDLQQGLDL